jgi:two-component system phosphoglycerate transport system response regulator PgtA
MVNILIVEDDLDLVETYTDLLEAKQFKVMSVLRAADAIQLVTRNRPDIIILDLNLPGESGTVVIRFVRGYPPIASTKIIVATGHPEIIQKTGYICSQIDAILTKPVSNETLLKIINGFYAPLSV